MRRTKYSWMTFEEFTQHLESLEQTEVIREVILRLEAIKGESDGTQED